MSTPKRFAKSTAAQNLANRGDFMTHNAALPSFWDERFERDFTPWDQAGVQKAFEEFASVHTDLSVLIPGCGNAWEARWLVERGARVCAIDFAPVAIARAQAVLGEYAPVAELADFFTYAPPFAPDWIFERAFLCALPKVQREPYAQRMAALLPPGGLLAGFFYVGDTPKGGPPFVIGRDALDALLQPDFELVDDRFVDDSIPVFAGRERWMTWRRRNPGGAAVDPSVDSSADFSTDFAAGSSASSSGPLATG